MLRAVALLTYGRRGNDRDRHFASGLFARHIGKRGTLGLPDMTARLCQIGAFLCILILACAAWSAGAQADKRIALVIGNSEYGPQARLSNPSNDARDIAESLKALGFETILRVDADKRHFLQALAEFERAVADADVGLFFYAGHGIQMNGSNYLVPVDAELQDDVSVRFEFVALDDVQRALERSAGVKILVLDACRNSPFTSQLARSLNASNRDIGVLRGLAPPQKARGTVIAYATQANDVATDGVDRNSPFTAALLASLREPGLEIGAMFRKVASRVYETTRGKQVPELSITLLSDVYLNRNETDTQVWGRVRAADDPATFRDFLARFPNSFHAVDARLRLDMLERADREKDLRDRLAALEIERLQAEMNLRAAARAAQDAAERLRLEQQERERLASEVVARQRAVADVTEQLKNEIARRGQVSAQATDRERELRTRLGELEQASQKAAADLAERARASAAEAAAKDKQIAALELARRQAEGQVSKLTEQGRILTEQALTNGGAQAPPALTQAPAAKPAPAAADHEPAGSPTVVPTPPPVPTVLPGSPPVAAGPGLNQQMANLNPEKPTGMDEGQLVLAIKTELSRLGCYSAPVDSNWQTPALRKAIADFAARTHLAKVPDSPAPQLLEDLKARNGRICGPDCGPREQESNGRCVAKTCTGNQVLDRNGNCQAPKPAEQKPAEQKPVASSTQRPHREDPPAPHAPGRAGCFNFNGRQFCE